MSPYPLWAYVFPFILFDVPNLSEDEWNALGQIGVVSLFDQYELFLFHLLIVQISDDLQIPEAHIGIMASIINLGSLPVLVIGLLADYHGRRSILTITIVGYTTMSALTAFSTSPAVFTAAQCLVRFFATSELALANVMICEMFQPAHRGWAIGALGSIAGTGIGLAYMAFSLIDWLPFGWRSMYLIGTIPLTCTAWLRRTMRETPLFEASISGITCHNASVNHPLCSYPTRMDCLAYLVGELQCSQGRSLDGCVTNGVDV